MRETSTQIRAMQQVPRLLSETKETLGDTVQEIWAYRWISLFLSCMAILLVKAFCQSL